ncbi:MAG: hypothetical protein MHM6MM_000524 [Cercozoa sp. M6MM]
MRSSTSSSSNSSPSTRRSSTSSVESIRGGGKPGANTKNILARKKSSHSVVGLGESHTDAHTDSEGASTGALSAQLQRVAYDHIPQDLVVLSDDDEFVLNPELEEAQPPICSNEMHEPSHLNPIIEAAESESMT